MNSGNIHETIDNLRTLALTLDLRLGVHARKQILAGNERITLSTDGQDLASWMSDVETRLKMVAGSQMVNEILANKWWLSISLRNKDRQMRNQS